MAYLPRVLLASSPPRYAASSYTYFMPPLHTTPNEKSKTQNRKKKIINKVEKTSNSRTNTVNLPLKNTAPHVKTNCNKAHFNCCLMCFIVSQSTMPDFHSRLTPMKQLRESRGWSRTVLLGVFQKPS